MSLASVTGRNIAWCGTARCLAMTLTVACACSSAADITGTITVTRKLTRPGVTAPVSMYERGPVVELGRNASDDPFADEKARVVVWVESSGPAAGLAQAVKSASASMRQINRQFDPDIVAVQAGGSVSFPNMDPIFHNVFSLSKPKNFDLGNYPKGDTRTVTFPKPGIVFVNCRLHPNMAGVIVVTPTQWYARVDRDGQYAMKDVPPGTYTVVAWHKRTGFIRREIHLTDGQDVVVDFLVPIGDNPAADSDSAMGHMKMASR